MGVTTIQQPLEEKDIKMKAAEWHGAKDIRINTARPKPKVTQEHDAIVRITASSVCGSDLHLYHKCFKGMEKGDILGHEGIGIIESLGPSAAEGGELSVGDRVVVSAVIADGTCDFCQQGKMSLCDNTNPSAEMKEMYGDRTSGLFGYSHLTGGYPGMQAQYVRVPYARVNCLKIPEDIRTLSDEKAVLLSDIFCTAWHANELGQVDKGSKVAIWGAGPVGILAAYLALHRGAANVLIIDDVQDRLDFVKKHVPDVDVLRFSDVSDMVPTLKQKFPPSGPDVGIDCVGFRYSKTWKHAIEKSLSMETDSADVVNEAILAVKKGGRISVIGDYIGYANHFAIGPFMEKALTMRGGQVYVQKYWKYLLQKMLDHELDPSFVITHRISLDAVPDAYKMFDKKEAGTIKILVRNDLDTL
jgi:threonine dehydrogenase-like Zn-dependent dehydrogenase